MRRNWKRITGIVLAFVLIIGQFMTGVNQTQAAPETESRKSDTYGRTEQETFRK